MDTWATIVVTYCKKLSLIAICKFKGYFLITQNFVFKKRDLDNNLSN